MKFPCNLVYLCFGMFNFFCFSQVDNIKFKTLSIEDGLSQSSVFSITQDKFGFIWIATFDGLNRYNGSEIEVFRHKDSVEGSLTDNFVQSLCIDRSGDLWVGTNSQGICKFQYYSETFTKFKDEETKSQDPLGQTILSIEAFDDSNIVVLSEEGINLINTFTNKRTQVSEDVYLEMLDVPKLISYFNKRDSTNYVLKDKKGNRWIGTKKGVRRIAAHKKSNIPVYRPASLELLSSNEITCIFEDEGGVIWVGTSLDGIKKWDGLNEDVVLYRPNENKKRSLSNSKVRCFYQDTNFPDTVWIGTVSGGLNLWNRATNEFLHWDTENSTLNSNHIRDVVKWKGEYLVALDGGGVQRFNKNTMHFEQEIDCIGNDMRVWDMNVMGDSLWIATYKSGLFLVTDNSCRQIKIPSESITWVTNDNRSNVWIGTFGAGVFQLSANGIKQWATHNSNLSDDRVYSIVLDQKENLWIGTKGGLNYLDYQTEKINYFSVEDGLPNNTVMGIVPVDKNNVWLTTNKGVCNFSPETNKSINYDMDDGLQNNEFLVHSFYYLKTGEILFGGINGFNVFPINGLSKNGYKPKTIITNFILDSSSFKVDTAFAALKTIPLTYEQNNFTIEFTGTSFAMPNKNRYSYFMEGFDDQWSISSTYRYARYTNLPSGKYTFKVKSSNNDGVWGDDILSLNIIIYPAYWETWWFKTIITILVLFFLFKIYTFRLKRVRLQNIKLEKEVSIRTQQVVKQKTQIENKNLIIEEALEDIQDSIKYAKNIQSALLPQESEINNLFDNAFIFFKPKGIVSGDFYWVKKHNGHAYFSVVDCTGHGVPGAFISIIGNDLLNQSLTENLTIMPSEILNSVNNGVINVLNQKDDDVAIRDGMDVALCALKYETNRIKLRFSGARNPLYIVRSKDKTQIEYYDFKIESETHILYVIKGTLASIGYGFGTETIFETISLEVLKDDMIYIFSDGYADQFGGPNNKKFKYSQFRELLLGLQDKSMLNQKEILRSTFKEWRGANQQIDDVCVMGVKV